MVSAREWRGPYSKRVPMWPSLISDKKRWMRRARSSTRSKGTRHLALMADGTKDEEVDEAVRKTVDAFGRVDVLINNAQTAVTGINIEDQTVADVMNGIDTGFLASFRYMKACFPYLKEAQGTVVNFASQAGLLGNVGMVGYNAAKEANRALTRTAAREWAQYNITVNCDYPRDAHRGVQGILRRQP